MTLTEALELWVRDAERMGNDSAEAVVVTEELFAILVEEQASQSPAIGGVTVLLSAATGDSLAAMSEMIEIAGPDRVAVYVGDARERSTYPLGLDPAMPVVFVPMLPHLVDGDAHLEMYNRLRWYGLAPDEALTGCRQ